MKISASKSSSIYEPVSPVYGGVQTCLNMYVYVCAKNRDVGVSCHIEPSVDWLEETFIRSQTLLWQSASRPTTEITCSYNTSTDGWLLSARLFWGWLSRRASAKHTPDFLIPSLRIPLVTISSQYWLSRRCFPERSETRIQSTWCRARQTLINDGYVCLIYRRERKSI